MTDQRAPSGDLEQIFDSMGERRSTKSSPSPRSFGTWRRRPPPGRSIQVPGSRGGSPQASLAAGGISAARRQPITRLASRPVRLVFIAYVVLIAVGLTFYIAIGITNQ
jgi:hypothetical protein